MKYFMHTVGTIPENLGFQPFDATHLGWLALFVVVAVGLSLLYRSLGETGRRRFRYIMAALIVGNELFKTIFLLIGDRYTLNYLPLHLCSINIVLITVHACKPFKALDNFLYTVCIPTAILALLLPTWTELPVLNFSHLHSFTVHIMLAAYPIALLAGGDIRPRLRYAWKSLLLLLGLAALIYLFNLQFDTNFMFLMKTDNISILVWFEERFGTHLVGFPVIAAALVAAMYLPIEVCAYARLKRATKEV